MIPNAFAGFSLAALLVSLASSSYAGDLTRDPAFSINGFGTLGLAHSSDNSADFTLHALQKEGAGATDEWSAKVDTRFGAQLTANLTPQVSAVLQAVVEQRQDGSFEPGVDWATLKYQATPELSFRIGRFILPLFLYSDNYKVGYAQHWLRAPVEVYRLIPLTSTTGIDVIHRTSHGDFKHTLQLAYGENSRRAPEGGTASIKDGWLISDTVENGALTLHATVAGSNLTMDSYDALFNGYRTIAQSGVSPQAEQARAILERYEPRNRYTLFYSVGASYDPGKWFMMSEVGQVDSKSVFGERFAWYATGGYRFGKFVPYLTYTQAKAKSPLSDPGVASADPAVQRLNAGLNVALAYVPEQKSMAIGTRWDFARNAALKVQYDHTHIEEGSFGTLQTSQTVPLAKRLNIFSVSVDWVF
jgi:hypothetical protein